MARRKKKSSLGKWMLILFVLILILLGLIAYIIVSGKGNTNPVTREIQREVTKQAVDKVITEQSGGSVSIKEMESEMTEEDSETLNDIVDKYSDSGLVSEALSIYSSNGGDIGATADQLKDKVSPEDVEALKELYEKYSGN
ncbi:MAG: hypothetical protein J5966_07540 [Lachnospiraceae bacterium]|nr:hypothetical protein [Lachnospiraceae bacterium]